MLQFCGMQRPSLFGNRLIWIRRIPVLRFLLPFMAGILICSLSTLRHSSLLACAWPCSLWCWGMAFLAIRTSIRRRARFGQWMLLLFFCSGISLTAAVTASNQRFHISRQRASYLLCEVAGAAKERQRSYRIPVQAKAFFYDGRWQEAVGNYWVYVPKQTFTAKPLHYRDRFVHRNTMQLFSEQDTSFGTRLQLYRQYYGRCYVNHWWMAGSGYSFVDLKRLALSTRQWVTKTLQHQMQYSAESAIAVALLVGEEIAIDEEVSTAYAATGTLHVLAVSGMHVGLIYLLLDVLLRVLLRKKWGAWIYYPMVLILVWAFTLVAGAAPSIVRAATMCSFMLVAKWSDRRSQGMGALGASLFFMLLPDPYQIYEPGLQLSFCAVLGIVWLQKYILRWWTPDNRMLHWIWELTAVSLSAQLLTLPVSLIYFGQFPNYFLLANLVVIPLTTACVYIGIAQLIFSPLYELSSVLAWINNKIIWLSDAVVLHIQGWPGAVSRIQIDVVQALFLFILLFGLEAWLRSRRFIHLLTFLKAVLILYLYAVWRMIDG